MHVSVVDVYSGWCGPCKSVLGLLRRLKNEVGKSGLLFAAVSQLLFAMEHTPHCFTHSWYICLPVCAHIGKE